MSPMQQDIMPDHSPDADELGKYIHAQEKLQKRIGTELRSARLADAARKIRTATPAIHDVIIATDGYGSTILLAAADTTGQPADEADLNLAGEIVAVLPSTDFTHPAGSRINISAASAWWTGR